MLGPRPVWDGTPSSRSPPLNDKVETAALVRAFGAHASRLAISSTKSMVGHLLGAAGAVELAATVLAMAHDVVPPTINLDTPDPDCHLDYVPGMARPMEIRCAISNNSGFGGQNSVIVVRRAAGEWSGAGRQATRASLAAGESGTIRQPRAATTSP